GGQTNDELGSSAAISGQNIILGEPLDNNYQKIDQGAVLVFGGLCGGQNLQPEVADRTDFEGTGDQAELRSFPIPFSDVLNIQIREVTTENARLTILNAMGQLVATIHDGPLSGETDFQWNARDITPGLYFLRLTTGEKVITRSIICNR
ncbi:MAG: T9SS type A sorting domain-containing protein, partial [Saprospiraceae bacterium]